MQDVSTELKRSEPSRIHGRAQRKLNRESEAHWEVSSKQYTQHCYKWPKGIKQYLWGEKRYWFSLNSLNFNNFDVFIVHINASAEIFSVLSTLVASNF
jgi:hypothetical protein